MYIILIRFLQTSASKVVFVTDRKILKKLSILKKICSKQIFKKYVGLN